jgi:ribosomal protein S18 acetylase RimI-like enzyme
MDLPTDIRIIRLTGADILNPNSRDQLIELLRQLRGKSGSAEAEAYVPPLPEQLHRAVTHGIVLVAVDASGRFQGTASLIPYDTLTHRTGLVDAVCVDEAYRGSGIARTLMNALIGHARFEGIQRIELTSNPSREAARALYASLGFTLRETGCFRLELQGLPRQRHLPRWLFHIPARDISHAIRQTDGFSAARTHGERS